MQIYRSKYDLSPGSAYSEAVKVARKQYHIIQRRSPRRQPYIRSRYFDRDKVFIATFWEHLSQKSLVDRSRRVRLFKCALDTIQNSTSKPETIKEATQSGIFLYRFLATTSSGKPFYVQIKENRRTGRKDFMSVFPVPRTQK